MGDRLTALEAVADAARRFGWHEGAEILNARLDALDALPPASEPAGDVVDVRAVVFRDRENGEIWVHAEPDAENVSPHYLERIAIITARVPLPTIPTIPARVTGDEG